MSICPIISDVNFNHCVKVFSSRFLQCTGTVSPFKTKYVVGSQFDTMSISCYYSLVLAFNGDACLNELLLSWLPNGHFKTPPFLHHVLVGFFYHKEDRFLLPCDFIYLYNNINSNNRSRLIYYNPLYTHTHTQWIIQTHTHNGL